MYTPPPVARTKPDPRLAAVALGEREARRPKPKRSKCGLVARVFNPEKPAKVGVTHLFSSGDDGSGYASEGGSGSDAGGPPVEGRPRPAASSSSSGATSSPAAPAAPAPAASSSSSGSVRRPAPGRPAPRGSRKKMIDGEEFIELWPARGGTPTLAALSIQCPYHEDCARDLHYVKHMTEPEAVKRLLRWRAEGGEAWCRTAADHHSFGGLLLAGVGS